jgi:hypothetical protein
MSTAYKAIEVSAEKTRGGGVAVTGYFHSSSVSAASGGVNPPLGDHFGPFDFDDLRTERLHGRSFDQPEIEAWTASHGGEFRVQDFLADKIAELPRL